MQEAHRFVPIDNSAANLLTESLPTLSQKRTQNHALMLELSSKDVCFSFITPFELQYMLPRNLICGIQSVPVFTIFFFLVKSHFKVIHDCYIRLIADFQKFIFTALTLFQNIEKYSICKTWIHCLDI